MVTKPKLCNIYAKTTFCGGIESAKALLQAFIPKFKN
jgi:hypothetical protein